MPPPGWSEFLRITRPDGSRGDAQALNSALAGGGRLVVAGDREMLHRLDRLLLNLFGAAFGALLLLGAITVLLFGRIVRRRLAAVEASAKAIVDGDMSKRLPLDGSGVELDQLSILLNGMLDHIERLVENLRAVSVGLAHDMRTPLSRLRAKIETAADQPMDSTQRELLEAAIAESDGLLELSAGLLAIAELDRREIRRRFSPVDLGDAAAAIGEVHRASLEDAGKALSISVEPISVLGDRVLLQRLIGNLLDNVLHHAAGASSVTLSAGRRGNKAVVRVGDDGPGIPTADRQRIFERLVRLDSSRSTPGHGLGLSMVAAIASVHGGSVSALPSKTGAIVELELPLVA